MRGSIFGLLLCVLLAPSAQAQTGKHFAIGPGIDFHKFADGDFSSKNPGISFIYRFQLKPEHTDGWSWSPKSAIGWSKTDTDMDIGGGSTRLGKLRTIPILGGIERSYRRGPLKIGGSVVAGPSFNQFSVDAVTRSVYQTRLGSTLNSIKVKNSVAIRPGFSAWYDLGRWVALHGSVSYSFNRPKAETTVDGVTTSSTWKTDHASLTLGFVVGVF